jgi:ArsR family transcriptional regulator, arsenate/arsenite/antimonite-responsive transcriptional repressor
MSTSPLTALVEVYKALAHPARLRILAMLRGGELCVCQITAVLGLAPSTVSAHLSELRRAGLVAERKDGRWVAYRLAESEAEGLLMEQFGIYLEKDANARADAELLRALRKVPLERLCRADGDLARVGIRVPGGRPRVGKAKVRT